MSRAKRIVRPENMAALIGVAHRLMDARDTVRGAIVKLDAGTVAALGEQLRRIAYGEDARDVFAQHGKRGNQSESVFNGTRAVVYARARVEGKSREEAGRLAREHFPTLPAPSVAAIERFFRKHRDAVLDAVELRSYRRLPDGSVKVTRRGPDTSAFRAYLATKAKGGNRPL